MVEWIVDFLKFEGAAIIGILTLLFLLGVFQIQLTNRVDVLYQYYKQLNKEGQNYAKLVQ